MSITHRDDVARDATLAVLGKWPASEFMDKDPSVVFDCIAGLAWELDPRCREFRIDEPDIEEAITSLQNDGKVKADYVAMKAPGIEVGTIYRVGLVRG